MNCFYFFKVTLSYFDDERKTFFITPDQSETDEQGVPFSENDLQDTAEFKEFVKTTKADIIDVDYTEFAVEYDPKKSDILSKPVTEDSFAELEKRGLLKVVDENQFLLLFKKQKKQGGKSKMPIVCVIIAAVVVIGVCAYGALGRRSAENSATDTSDLSDVPESNSDEISDSGSESKASGSSSDDSSAGASASESSDNSSVNSSTQSTASSTTSTTAPEPSEAVSSVASSVPSSQSSYGTSSDETHEAVTASSDVAD